MNMSITERIFHSVLFEIGGVSVATVAVMLGGLANGGTAFSIGLLMAGLAVVWNFIFNYIFDKIVTGQRELRGLKIRLLHTALFQAGFMCISVPISARLLNLSIMQALATNIGLTVLITVYALLFNWTYDVLRAKRLTNRTV